MSNLIAIYAAFLSTFLALFELYKYWKSTQYLRVDSNYSWNPSKSLNHEIWVMNTSTSPLTIMSLYIGTATRSKYRRKIRPECCVSLLNDDENGEQMGLTLAPGEARHFTASAVSLRTAWIKHAEFLDVDPNTNNFQMLEVLHSMARKPQYILLDLGSFSWDEIDTLPAPDPREGA